MRLKLNLLVKRKLKTIELQCWNNKLKSVNYKNRVKKKKLNKVNLKMIFSNRLKEMKVQVKKKMKKKFQLLLFKLWVNASKLRSSLKVLTKERTSRCLRRTGAKSRKTSTIKSKDWKSISWTCVRNQISLKMMIPTLTESNTNSLKQRNKMKLLRNKSWKRKE